MGVFDSVDHFKGVPVPEPSEFGRGLRSGADSAVGALHNVAGAVAEQFGASDFARDRYADADARNQQAAEWAPRVGSYRDVRSLRDAGDYVAGLAGGIVQVAVPALAATLLTGGGALPAIAAGTAVTTPFEVGDVIGRQRAEGRPVSLRDAGVAGLVSAAGQNALPGLARASLAGRARVPGGALAAIPEQAALSAGGELVKQVGVNPENPTIDTTAAVDAGVAGAVLGAPVAGMAALGGGRQSISAAAGKAKDATAAGLDKAKTALGKAGEQAADLGGEVKGKVLEGYDSLDVPTRLGEVFDKGRTAMHNMRERMANSEDVVGDIKSFAGAQGDKLAALLQADDDNAIGKAREWAGNLMKEKLDPEQMERLQTAASNLGDRVNQATVAGMARARDGFKSARDTLTKLAQRVTERADEQRAGKGVKKTEDDSGIVSSIVQAITPEVQKARPDLFDGSSRREQQDLMTNLGRVLRRAVEDAANGKPFDSNTVANLRGITGGKTADLLDAVHRAVGETDPKRTANTFKRINAVADMEESHRGIVDLMAKSVRPDIEPPSRAQLDESVALIKHWATMREQYPDDARVKFKDRRTRERLEEQFGKETDKVIAAVEKTMRKEENLLADESRDTSVRESDTDRDPGEQMNEDGERQYLFNKEGELYLSPEHDQGKGDHDSAAVQAMRRAQAKYPKHAVSFAPVSELGMEHPAVAKRLSILTDALKESGMSRDEAQAGALDMLKKYGVVSIEGTRQETAIGPHELKSIRLDTNKYGDSASRIDTVGKKQDGNIPIDAVKLTEYMNRRLSGPDDWTEGDRKSGLHRKARMFMEGIAAMMEHTNKVFDVPDSTVIDKSGTTWGQVKNLHYSTETRSGGEMPGVRELEAQLEVAREAYAKEAAKRNPDQRRLAAIKERGQKLAALIESLDTDTRLKGVAEDAGKTEFDPFGNVRETLGGRDDPDAAIRTNQTGLPRADDLTNNQTPAAKSDPRANKGPLPKEGAPDPKVVAAKKAAFLERVRSGDEGLIEQLASSDDAKGLQRALKSLLDTKQNDANTVNAMNAINRRLMTLVTDEDTAYGMQTQKYSLQAAGNPGGRVDKLERQLVQNYIGKVLGPQVKVAWARMPHAGEFERVFSQQGGFEDVIRLSAHSLNPISPAYHESLHAFVRRLKDAGRGDVIDTLMRASEEPYVLQQMRDIMKARGFNEAAIKQLNDQEERAAYMYQFWADGSLKLGQKSSTVLGRIAEFVRSVLGVWSNDERALHILRYFHEGDFAKAQNSARLDEKLYNDLMAPGRNKAIETARKMAGGLANVGEAVAVAGGQRLRDTGIPALRELADVVKLHGTAEGDDAGFLPAARAERARVMNKLGADLKQFNEASINAALEALQAKNDAAIKALGSSQERADAYTAKIVVRKTLDSMYQYMSSAGVKVNDLGVGKDYFPRVYDTSYISKHTAAFKDVLVRHGVKDPVSTLRSIMTSDGAEFTIETDMPGMQHLKPRQLAHIPDSELAPFMRKDLLFVMQSYVAQATRRAEWARRLGDKGERITELLSQAKDEGASPQDLGAARKFVRAVDGTLGDTINPEARRLMGNMIVYQNLRLLPLAVFSSVVDPMGIMVRGGTLDEAFNAFKRGVSEIPKSFKKSAKDDEATKLAASLGVIDDSTLVHTLGALYSQGMVGDTGRKINDVFFRYNLMEQFNTSMRVSATEAAIGFLTRHADGKASRHSERWLAELGLRPGDVKLDADGRPDLTDPKIKMAINRWVDGAVLRPDAADKPLWMSDPHFSLIAHLKQFTYSFHETILKRVAHEYQNGNYTPAMALASYVPIMIAADMAKGMIVGGGEQPDWKESWGLSDYVFSGMERAGVFGVGQFGIDAFKDVQRGGSGVGALAGPTLEQLGQAVSVVGGRAQFDNFVLRSMPANALYGGVLSEEPATVRAE